MSSGFKRFRVGKENSMKRQGTENAVMVDGG